MKLKVLTYNIHKGFDHFRTTMVLDTVREHLRSIDADIVLLQEVVGKHPRNAAYLKNWPNENQLEFLADEVWHHYSYGKNAVYDLGHHGNAILSKFPIQKTDNIDISTNRFESRGLLHAQLEIPESRSTVHVFCTHLNLLHGARLRQIESTIDLVKGTAERNDAIILGGDFNDWNQRLHDPLTQELKLVDAYREIHGVSAKTFPALFPGFSLDRIYCKNLQPVDAILLKGEKWRILSDHVPIVVELQISVPSVS